MNVFLVSHLLRDSCAFLHVYVLLSETSISKDANNRHKLSRQRFCLTLEWQVALFPDQHDKHIILLQTKVGKGQLFVKLGLLLASDSRTVR